MIFRVYAQWPGAASQHFDVNNVETPEEARQFTLTHLKDEGLNISHPGFRCFVAVAGGPNG